MVFFTARVPSAPALSFKGIQPGISDKAAVDRILGPGKPSVGSGKYPWFEYALEPYAAVGVQYIDSIVKLIHLKFNPMVPMPQVLEALEVTGDPEATQQREDGAIDHFLRQGLVVAYQFTGKQKMVQWVNFRKPRYLKIENLWLEYGKEHPDYFWIGVILHVDFEAVGLMNESVALDSWYTLQDPDKLDPAIPGKAPPYSDKNGNAWCGNTFKPRREVVHYKDFQLFMPYNQLFIPEGKNNLEVELRLTAQAAAPDSVKKKFHLNLKSASNEARILAARMEHNVMEDDLKGTRVHLHFMIWNHKNTKCRATLFVYAMPGMFPIKGYDMTNAEGEIMSRSFFTPKNKVSEYKDITIFLPYKEIRKQVSGEADLVGRVVIRDNEDNLLAETHFYFKND